MWSLKSLVDTRIRSIATSIYSGTMIMTGKTVSGSTAVSADRMASEAKAVWCPIRIILGPAAETACIYPVLDLFAVHLLAKQ
jgi:hypothetical protein